MKSLSIRIGSIIMILLLLAGCGRQKNYEELLAASWFAEGDSEPAFTLYNDGTCEIDGEYGIGKWSVVNDNQLKLTNYYGETETAPIISVEDGCLKLGNSPEDAVPYWDTAEKALAASEEMTEEDTSIQNTSIEYYSCKDYSDGYAWVQYGKGDKNYWASIDKTGKVICSFDADMVTKVYPYENGYAYLEYSDKFEVIDTSGRITASYSIDDDNIVKAYGNGYVLTQKYAADFDSSGYTYTIYNYDGSVLDEIESEEELVNSCYCGNGVFGFNLEDVDGYNGYPNTFYSATDRVWTSCLTDEFDVNFLEDTTAMAIDYGSPDTDGYRGKLRLMNKNGQLSEVLLYPEYGWNWSTDGLTVNENICVLYDYSGDQLFSYSLTDGQFYKLDDSYAEKVIWDALPNPLAFFNDRIVLPMRGSDGERYIAAFDHKWNIIFEPMQATSNSAYSENRLIASDDGNIVVYDENGSVVFSVSEKGFSAIAPYHDGVARIADDNISPTYLDENGNVLFEQIDFGNAEQ